MTGSVSRRRVRAAGAADLPAIRRIYNEGIADRQATLESEPKTAAEIDAWFARHTGRCAVLVAEEDGGVAGWASLAPFSHRCAHAGIADVSIYVARERRGCGIGTTLLTALEDAARAGGFHKLVLHALDRNAPAKHLYRKAGFSQVGVFAEHGILDGRYEDVVAMEKLLR